MTQNEFIIPLTPSTKDLSLYRRPSNQDGQYKIKHSIPNMDASVSIRPLLYISEKQIETRSAYHHNLLIQLCWTAFRYYCKNICPKSDLNSNYFNE